jgi:hypothetical protein
MPRVEMAVAIPSTLNTLLQTLSCTAFRNRKPGLLAADGDKGRVLLPKTV